MDNIEDLYSYPSDGGGGASSSSVNAVYDPFAPINPLPLLPSSAVPCEQQQLLHQQQQSSSSPPPASAAPPSLSSSSAQTQVVHDGSSRGTAAEPANGGGPASSAASSQVPAGTAAGAAAGDAAGGSGSFSPERIDVKLFVGRLPKSIEADAVRELFAEYGEVAEVVIIRDKCTQQHKGAAFVRMASLTEADAAVRALANQRVIDPQLGALQVRYANGEVERLGLLGDAAEPGKDLGKLFIGSLPRGLTEDVIKPMFEPFGPIQEIVLMKDNSTGATKGCGFVKYEFKEHAIQAVRTLHESQTMDGVPRPLEVKFAENKRAAAAAAAAAAGGPAQQQQQPQSQPQSQQPPASAAASRPPRQANGWVEYFTKDGRPYYHHDASQKTQWSVPPGFSPVDQAAAAPAGQQGQTAGPLGANVFVFHIPPEWGQNEVAMHFTPFGEIVSCYVAVDRATARNKGYAFVSYSTIEAACAAVQATNGQPIGSKRLKVSIKTGEEQHAAPYMAAAVAAVQQQYPPDGGMAAAAFYQQYGYSPGGGGYQQQPHPHHNHHHGAPGAPGGGPPPNAYCASSSYRTVPY